MAVYVSRYARHRVNMIPKDHGVRYIGKHEFPRVMPELTIRFRDCKPGFPTNALPASEYEDGRPVARGIWDSERDFPAKEAAIYEVTVEDVIEFLDSHPHNAATDDPGPKFFARVEDPEQTVAGKNLYLRPVGDGKVECRVCQKVLDHRGVANHLESAAHKELQQQANAEALSA